MPHNNTWSLKNSLSFKNKNRQQMHHPFFYDQQIRVIENESQNKKKVYVGSRKCLRELIIEK